jgi:hypothetical protein
MADTLDVLTQAEAEQEIGLQSDQYPTEVASLVTAVSRRLDSLCGPIVQRTVTDEVYSGGRYLFLRYRPVASVTTVVEYAYTTGTTLTAETNLSKSTDNYHFDPRLGVIYRRSGGADIPFTAGRENIVVTYVAGRYATTASVDARFKQAARICIKHLWNNEKATGTQTFGSTLGYDETIGLRVPTFAIPRAAVELIADELIGEGSAPVIA